MTLSSKLYAGDKVVQMLYPQTITTVDTLSAKFDTQDYSDLMIEVCVGARGDTLDSSNYFEIEVQDSDDDSTYAATADANISNPVTGRSNTGTMAVLNTNTSEKQNYLCAYRGNKRYVKVNVNSTGSHATGTIIGINGHGWVSRAQPVNAG